LLIWSEISVTVWTRFSGLPFSAGKALEDQGEQKAAGEGSSDRCLRAFGGNCG
jgi:hypothetical protein